MIDPRHPNFTNTPASPDRAGFDYVPAVEAAPPAVTIVTPFYNTGLVFHETARSILRQSFQQWEWLIVDDGSTDEEARALLEQYEASDPRIRVVWHAGNRGLSAARNTGFREARTPYVVLVDSDDLLEPTAVEKWYWFLETHPEYAWVKGWSVQFGAIQGLWDRGFQDREEFLNENLVSQTSMIRRSAHDTAGGYDEENRGGLEDWEFWLRCASAGQWGASIPEYLDWYRRRPSHDDRWPNWTEDSVRAFRARLREEYPELWNGGFPHPREKPGRPNEPPGGVYIATNRLRKERRRLLVVTAWLEMGGADKFNLDVIEQLSARGWEVTIAATVDAEQSWMPRFAKATSDVFVLPHFLPIADYPRFLSYLIASRQADVVMIAHSEFGYRVLPYLRSRHAGIPFVDFCHLEEEHWNAGGYARMAVDYGDVLDLNLVSSEHLRAWMAERDADVERVRVCRTNIDTNSWRPDGAVRARVRGELGVENGTSVVMYVGRICEQKQPEVFARTMESLAHGGADVLAVVAGDGPDWGWLAEFVTEHRLRRHVRLLGAVSNERLRELLQAADIFFLPSKWEGIALSIYEAMACGLPIISSDVGGQRELVTPGTGVLLPPSDVATETERYAALLGELIADPDLRRLMGDGARARVESGFRLEQMIDRLVELFDEAAQLTMAAPRPRIPLSLGEITAGQAVQYFTLATKLDRLSSSVRRTNGSWRTRTYATVQRLLHPYYKRALERDANWVVPLKRTLKRALRQA